MSKISDVFSVFYSSTSSNPSFDRREVFQRVCRDVGIALSVTIHIIDWKVNIPGGVANASGQDAIDEFVKGKYDIYFGCLGANFGRGTIAEYEKAMAEHLLNGEPKQLLFGFDETPVNPYSIDRQFAKVLKFRSEIERNTKYGKALLYFTFAGPDEFRDKAFLNLSAAANNLLARISGGVRIR